MSWDERAGRILVGAVFVAVVAGAVKVRAARLNNRRRAWYERMWQKAMRG